MTLRRAAAGNAAKGRAVRVTEAGTKARAAGRNARKTVSRIVCRAAGREVSRKISLRKDAVTSGPGEMPVAGIATLREENIAADVVSAAAVPVKVAKAGTAPEAAAARRTEPAVEMRNRHLSLLRTLMAVILCLLTVSCSRPAADEHFVLNSGRDAYGRYPFDVDMDDSTASYSLSVYAAFSGSGRRFGTFRSLPAILLWESPSGRAYESDVLLAGDSLQTISPYSRVLTSTYMTGASPVETGRWRLYVAVPADSVVKYGMTGLGIKLKRDNGTR